MHVEPDISKGKINACIPKAFGLHLVQIEFLPLGADQHTVVYRVVSNDGTPYFLKLRYGAFNETIATLPKYLYDQGVVQIILPLPNRAGKLWTKLDDFNLILYPFIDCHNGYETSLTDQHWIELGAVLQKIHTLPLSENLTTKLQRETWTPKWRRTAETYLDMAENAVFDDPIASALAGFLKEEGPKIIDLIRKADLLASELHSKPLDFVLCHSDIHAGNILIDSSDHLYIIDWDEPILAPKERDLMYAGGCQFLDHRTPQEEERLFYLGYVQNQVDPQVLAYYRFERIIQDIAIYWQQIFEQTVPIKDREQAIRYLQSNFQPNGTIDVAVNADRGRV